MTRELYFQLLYGWIFLAFIVFLVNLKIVAPYGRHTKNTWGPMMNNRLAWVLMEMPVLILVVFLFFNGTGAKNWYTYLTLSLFVFHYVHRTLIYPFRLRASKKDMPVLIMLFAVIFNLANGFFIGYALGNFPSYPDSWWRLVLLVVGLGLFWFGLFVNWRSDTILINLRQPGEDGYKIPQGFLFEKISCPNHFGEIIEWSGFAMVAFSLGALSFVIWTAANLIPRALAHHNWYKQNFANYPKERKALIPGIL